MMHGAGFAACFESTFGETERAQRVSIPLSAAAVAVAAAACWHCIELIRREERPGPGPSSARPPSLLYNAFDVCLFLLNSLYFDETVNYEQAGPAWWLAGGNSLVVKRNRQK